MEFQQKLLKENRNKGVFLQCKWIEILVFAILVVLGNRITTSLHILAAVFVAICILKSDVEDAFCWSILLIPNIRVFDNLGYTFIVNLLLALPLIVYFIRRGLNRIYLPVFGAIALFVVELLHGFALDNLNSAVNLIGWTLNFILCITITMDHSVKIKKENVFGALTTGVILSATMYLISVGTSMFEIISSMSSNIRLEAYANDPNYYSTYICLAMAYVLYINGKDVIRIVAMLLLTGIGLLTASKMCLLIMLFEYAVFFLQLLKPDIKGRKNRRFILGLFLIGGVAVFLLRDYVGMIIENFFRRLGIAASGVIDVNKVTTGRLGIVSEYIEILFNNFKCLLFGYGFNYHQFLGQSSGHGAHNTYLDIILSWGILGVIIFSIVIYCWLYSYCKVRAIRKIQMIAMLPMFVLLLNFFSLSCLSANVFPFLITVAIIPWQSTRESLEERGNK